MTADQNKEESLTLFASPEWRSKLPWPVLTTLSAVVAALTGWLIVVGYGLLGWTEIPEVPLSRPLFFATQIWLLAHGANLRLLGGVLTIAPLGLSLLLVIIVSGLAGWVAGHVQLTSSSARGKWFLRIGVLFAVEYAVIVSAIAISLLGAKLVLPVFGGALLIGLSGLFSVTRALGGSFLADIQQRFPFWVRGLPRVILGGISLLLGSAALALVCSLIANREHVTFLQKSLDAGGVGTFLLLVGQLAFLPNFILWATGWITGSGVSLGLDTIMSPVANQVGILPTIPVFGIVPETGAAPWYHNLWLLLPVLVGIAVARAALKPFENLTNYPRADFTSLVGGLASLSVGLIVALLALLSGGDLGEIRLINVGVQWPAMLIISPTLLGFSGLFTGLVIGLRHRSPAGTGSTVDTQPESEQRDESSQEVEVGEIGLLDTEVLDNQSIAIPDSEPEAQVPPQEEEDIADPLAHDDEVEEQSDRDDTEDVIAKLVQSTENAFRRDAGLPENE